MALADWGWSEDWADKLLALGDEPGKPARVSNQERTLWTIQTERGPRLARMPSACLPDDAPAVGDWVVTVPGDAESDPHSMRGVLPRRSKFSRQAAGQRAEEQIVAANVDRVWILNGFGVPVWVVGTMGPPGCQELADSLVAGTAIALLGLSGVGKSSLVNRLAGAEILETGEVRSGDKKGRHTTTRRELVRLEGGALLLDTPGMLELQLWELETGLAGAFPEIEGLANDCRFRDCRHQSEPGCAVLAAVDSGSLSRERLDS